MAELIVVGLLALGLLPKALQEWLYFKDRNAAKQTLKTWGLCTASVLGALAFALLINYTG